MTMPAMAGMDNREPEDEEEAEAADEGVRMVMVSLVKTVSERPTSMLAAGCCWHPARMATRTGQRG